MQDDALHNDPLAESTTTASTVTDNMVTTNDNDSDIVPSDNTSLSTNYISLPASISPPIKTSGTPNYGPFTVEGNSNKLTSSTPSNQYSRADFSNVDNSENENDPSDPMTNESFFQMISDHSVSQGQESSDNSIVDNNKLIKWLNLNQICSIVSAYGNPTCFIPTKQFIIIGTSKGFVLIFNLKEHLQSILFPHVVDTNSKTSDNHNPAVGLKSSVQLLSISRDGTYLSAAYKSGDVFVWNLNLNMDYNQDDKNDIPGATDDNKPLDPLSAVLHINYHKGIRINGLAFVSNRHTGLLVSDSSGKIVFHSGHRNNFWKLVYNSKILWHQENENLLSSKMVSVSQRFSSSFKDNSKYKNNLIATLTTKSFIIISTNPHPSILFRERILSQISTPIYNYSTEWSPDKSMVAYSINNRINIFFLGEDLTVGRHPLSKSTSLLTESILSIQWVSNQLLGLLTISHQFFLVDIKCPNKILMKLDLLVHDLLIPPDKHFHYHNTRIYLMTLYNFKIGKFANWSDLILNLVQQGAYIKALRLIELFLNPNFSLAPILKLHSNQTIREKQLADSFYNLSLATLKHLLGEKNRKLGDKRAPFKASYNKIFDLFTLVLRVFSDIDSNSKTTLTRSFLEQSVDFFNNFTIGLYFESLSNLILQGTIKLISPTIFKEAIIFYANSGRFETIQNLVINLNPMTLDVDLAFRLCKKYNLNQILIYLWNKIFGDYTTPLGDFICLLTKNPQECMLLNQSADESLVFNYLGSILTGEQYPLTHVMLPVENGIQLKAKMDLYNFLLSGTLIPWPKKGANNDGDARSKYKLHTMRKTELDKEPIFPYFQLLLNYNVENTIAMLDRVFEDSIFNSIEVEDSFKQDSEGRIIKIDRKYIIDLIVDIIKQKQKQKQEEHKVEQLNETMVLHLAIFVSTNSAKYPQFIKLSRDTISLLISILCDYYDNHLRMECQKAIESILPFYSPPDPNMFILKLKERDYNRVLFSYYRRSKMTCELLEMALLSDNLNKDYDITLAEIFDFVLSNRDSRISTQSQRLSEQIVAHFDKILTDMGTVQTIEVIQRFDSNLHQTILDISDGRRQQKYLEYLAVNYANITTVNQVTTERNLFANEKMREIYTELSCQYKSEEELLAWIKTLNLKTVHVDKLIERLRSSKNFEPMAIVHEKLYDYDMMVNDLLQCIKIWFKSDTSQYQKLQRYVKLIIGVSDESSTAGEEKWTELIACLITIYSGIIESPQLRNACNRILQEIFVSLVHATGKAEAERFEVRKNDAFWKILARVLEHKGIVLMKAQHVNGLLRDIFSVYTVEECLSSLILKLFNDSSYSLVEMYTTLLKQGWSIKNDECEICGKKLWGVGLDPLNSIIWLAETKDINILEKDAIVDDIRSMSLDVVVFKCNHGYHQRCLENLKQTSTNFRCLMHDRIKDESTKEEQYDL
ncbi:CORVET complex membrane-binding subunit VPS8 NDAI_0J01790 [Naumovozyma dairenensis CBS 421]|uniref:Uncharacterized protein n=1 Tax=Naumovozyma dairenensis (strain ATCC 10597 / BCRC 20456 / CBS 421 / NBRC 0211 / NRRL Y-12639) TaxID=1071378 RepID=G0WGZ3_NAUDC|nr:hypothetical protein NDAI_0J01790 [Naumovozyma dairenensis CBS 421]CCD27071.1 hypothetical protein NDAI_0J01790 [Naumovozyma dairenensis CBS 421]